MPLAPDKVIGQHLVLLGQTVGIQCLDGLANQAVEFLAPLLQQRVVRHVLGESMFEHVDQLGKERFFIDQLDGFELLQVRLRAVPHVCQPVQQATGELPANDRRRGSSSAPLAGGRCAP